MAQAGSSSTDRPAKKAKAEPAMQAWLTKGVLKAWCVIGPGLKAEIKGPYLNDDEQWKK